MRPETNNEMDLLLRRMARGNGAAHDGGVQNDDRHLDADELSSFAQNALPAAARARYMEHLADCATCRGVVTELSRSLGSAALVPSVETVDKPSSWKAFFASLFSPMVLRYAVPALGVIIVMVVGFVVLRRQSQQEFTAQLRQSESAPVATTPSPEAFNYSTAPKLTDKVESQNGKADARGTSQPKAPDDRPAAVAGNAPAAAAPSEQKSVAELKPGVASEPPAPAKTATPQGEAQQETDSVAKKQPDTEKEKVEEARRPAKNEAPRDQLAASQPAATEQHQPTPAPTTTTYALRGLMATKRADDAKTRGASKDAGNSNADEETRSVAGRRFRKQGNAWIDTAYESSTTTVNMTRDSEQFRALVADEPAIGTIAKQLDGEVIVVWKGHAYRIR
jgi:hypothetical protein